MPNDPVTGKQRSRPTMYVMVGLPASGKTTRARQLETDCRALRLTPDEWMIPLFAQAEAGGKRDVLEGRLVWLAIRILFWRSERCRRGSGSRGRCAARMESEGPAASGSSVSCVPARPGVQGGLLRVES